MTAGWTEDRVGALKKLWLEGQSASQIAKQLGGGVTRNAVTSQPARATFRPSRPRPAQPTQAPSAPRRIEAVQPRAVSAPSVPAPMPDLPGTATVMTLGAHMCKWPIGDPSSNEFSFCGRRSSEGVYCVEHARVAYQPQVKRGGATDLARSLRRYM
jgi:GcrA cell cycle regulator